MIEDEAELTRLVELEEAMEEFTPDEPEYQHALEEAEVSSPEELTKKISVLQQKIDKTRQKMLQASNAAAVEEEVSRSEAVFALLEILYSILLLCC